MRRGGAGALLDGRCPLAWVLDDAGRFLAAIACHGPNIRLSAETLRGFLSDFDIAVEKMHGVLT